MTANMLITPINHKHILLSQTLALDKNNKKIHSQAAAAAAAAAPAPAPMEGTGFEDDTVSCNAGRIIYIYKIKI